MCRSLIPLLVLPGDSLQTAIELVGFSTDEPLTPLGESHFEYMRWDDNEVLVIAESKSSPMNSPRDATEKLVAKPGPQSHT